jgi:hypothetical protein
MTDDRADEEWQQTGARIDTLIDSFGPLARERAEELVRLVTDLYGAGLERLLDLLHSSGALTPAVLTSITNDGLISALLLVHDLHPEDAATRITKAVAGLGGVELVGVTGDVATLRLTGHGCGLQQAATEAVEAVAPEVASVRFEEPPPAVIPVSSLFSRVARTP